MKTINIILLLAGGFILAACDRIEKIEYGKMGKDGMLLDNLCKHANGRITDMRSMSFELPELFKQAPCVDWSGYVYDSAKDAVNVSIPSVVARGNLMAIGLGGHSMRFSPGVWYSQREKKWQYLGRETETAAFSPEVFLEKRTYINNHNVREYGFVKAWSGGRCGRILFGTERSLDYIHEVQYYCWPHSTNNKRQMPFYIRASQSIPKKKEGIPDKSDFTDLDNQLVKPVLDSLVFTPYSDEALQFMADDHARICREHRDIFLNKTENRIWGDFPDRRSVILSMRDCGHDVPLPSPRIDSYDEIFEKTRDEKLGYYNITRSIPKEYQPIEIRYPDGIRFIYKNIVQLQAENPSYSPPIPSPGVSWYVYKIPRDKFARIKQKLLALDVLKETEPVVRKMPDFTQEASFWRGRPSIDIPYEAWYYAPPRYQRSYRRYGHSYRAGFGFRYDQELNANVIDINFDDPKTISTYRFVTLVEGD